jgi:hypothetical protein
MTRIIRINDCSECPSKDHNGAYGRIAYIPICRAVGRELPYTVEKDKHMGIYAHRLPEIPEWCPLEPLDKLS